ncbi:unnamed protein product [Arabis nemorensis]|uniref:Uncharacterized protein n=1 Tax=Arabis nemorensis TaxID=586526 RepID=A0A565BHZ4_9BRAS|nr:unnamed protein product [Arabis nemorensis]
MMIAEIGVPATFLDPRGDGHSHLFSFFTEEVVMIGLRDNLCILKNITVRVREALLFNTPYLATRERDFLPLRKRMDHKNSISRTDMQFLYHNTRKPSKFSKRGIRLHEWNEQDVANDDRVSKESTL